MTDHGKTYRDSVRAVADARVAWAAAEIAWHECAQPRRTGRAWPDCACGEHGEALTVAADAVRFAQGCVVAAGEAVKGERFATVMARNIAAREKD